MKKTEKAQMARNQRNWHLTCALIGATGKVRTHIEKAIEANSKLDKLLKEVKE